MSVFVMADLHLSKSVNKPMDIFGSRWQGYTEKIAKNWNKIITNDDTVIIPGDISWALTLEESLLDLEFINSMPGKKILLKGNHDFWWPTTAKLKNFLNDNKFETIDILFNNAHIIENFVIAGSRGWYIDEKFQNTINETDFEKTILREAGRLKLSLDNAKKLDPNGEKEILVFLHFPPCFGDFICEPVVSVLKEYDIKKCYFGHIHGNYTIPPVISYENINFYLISADYLDFVPKKL